MRAAALIPMLVALGTACAPEAVAEPPGDPLVGYVECTEPRPEVCTREYRPVCAQRDTGIRCVTTPCDSSEWVTRSNACLACSKPEVLGHRPGRCS